MKIYIETTRENQHAIYSVVKEKYPEANVQLIIKKDFTTTDLIQIGLSSAQVVIGIIALIPTLIAKDKEPKIKITIKDEIKGSMLTLEGNRIHEAKVVHEFIEGLDK